VSGDYHPCTLNVTLDELVGRTEPSSVVVIQNPKLRPLYNQIHRPPDEDQQGTSSFSTPSASDPR
jgi:hypothetical protein